MAFPTLSLLDSFKRAENPLSNGGKWSTFLPVTGSTGFCVESIDWEHAEGAAGKTYGAYWNPTEFTEPGVAITRDRRITDEGYWSLWACISHPTTSEVSGYCLKWKFEGTNFFEAKLERCDKNVFTVLGTLIADGPFENEDKIGLLVSEGKVEYWKKHKAEAWVSRLSVVDGTYTKGFVGFLAKSANGDTTNFEAGNSNATPSIENPGKQRSRTNKSVSLQIHALNAVKYSANLPLGLAINETTGLITGEPTTEESVFVKLKGENEAKVVAETSFEWFVTTRNSNVLNMVSC